MHSKPSNPKAVDNGLFLLDRFKGRSLKIHSLSIPERYFLCSKYELEAMYPPNDCMRRIKERFWRLNLEWRPGTKFSVHSLHEGICTYQHFYHNILKNPAKWSWILRNDIVAHICFRDVEAHLAFRLEEILKLPIAKKDVAIIKNVKAIRESACLILDLYENIIRYK